MVRGVREKVREGPLTWDVHPEAVRDGRGDALPQAEGVPAHKVCALAVGVIQGVEEVGCRRRQQVLDVLGHHVDVLAGGVLGDEAVVICGRGCMGGGYMDRL